MKLLLLLNGYKENIISANQMNIDDFVIVKIDDKDLAKPRNILNIIKQSKAKEVYFGCKELALQRFQHFMKIYAFLSGKPTAVIDESGSRNDYSFLKFSFIEMPLLCFEAVASAFIVIFYHFKFAYDKWIYLKKN